MSGRLRCAWICSLCQHLAPKCHHPAFAPPSWIGPSFSIQNCSMCKVNVAKNSSQWQETLYHQRTRWLTTLGPCWKPLSQPCLSKYDAHEKLEMCFSSANLNKPCATPRSRTPQLRKLWFRTTHFKSGPARQKTCTNSWRAKVRSCKDSGRSPVA